MDIPDRIDPLHDGKDGRTDALGEGCETSPRLGEISGISEFEPPGMRRRCTRFLGGVSLTDMDTLVGFARQARSNLAIIGPEEPLWAGAADTLETELGIPTFGPYGSHTRIEASKSWARELVETSGIPGNPEYRSVRSSNELRPYFEQLGEFVVKPDGLTGGKGVKLSGEHLQTIDEAVEYASGLIRSDGVVVVEERLEGEEFSLQSVTDGETTLHCPLVQDHKRADEGDKGPNTGGMGSYSCADHSLPFLTNDDVSLAKSVNERVVAAMGERLGRPYRGVLYGGFMATSSGVRLIEYNARFGDPEAMNVLPILDGDLLEMCWAAATGHLSDVDISFKALATVCKYVVPEQYPNGKGAGDPIYSSHLESELSEDIRLYWAAVNQRGTQVYMTGSRALAVVGIGESVSAAEEKAEHAASLVKGNVRHRSDIGTSWLIDRRINHMKSLRH